MALRDPERRRAYNREYAAKNRERVRQKGRESQRRRRADPVVAERERASARERSRKYRTSGAYLQWQAANRTPEDRWALHLWTRHKMRPAQWEAMRDAQDGLCYLCQRPLPEDRKFIHVDHDHSHCAPHRSCGLCRRGLACQPCNKAIGLLGDSPERLRVAAGALERAQAVARTLIMGAPRQDALF